MTLHFCFWDVIKAQFVFKYTYFNQFYGLAFNSGDTGVVKVGSPKQTDLKWPLNTFGFAFYTAY